MANACGAGGFNGAADGDPRKAKLLCDKRAIATKCFNGAADGDPRKGAPRPLAAVPGHASMGPRMGIRGKARAATGKEEDEMLQWGRGWGSAESGPNAVPAMGRGYASMGPRMGIRGK